MHRAMIVQMIVEMIQKKYILAYQRISGMSSQMIFLFKCTIIKKTTEKTV